MFSKAQRFNTGKLKQNEDKENNKDDMLKVIPKEQNAQKLVKKPGKMESQAEKPINNPNKIAIETPKVKSIHIQEKKTHIPYKNEFENSKAPLKEVSGCKKQAKELCTTNIAVTKSEAAKCTKPATTPVAKAKLPTSTGATKKPTDTLSQCSSTRSVKSFLTPKPVKNFALQRGTSSSKKPLSCTKSTLSKITDAKVIDEVIKTHEVEIRNKDQTIVEYERQIEDLKNHISNLQKQVDPNCNYDCDNLQKQFSEIKINKETIDGDESDKLIHDLKGIIGSLENQCNQLELEVSNKQVELSSLEEIICIRDSLCKDLQDKLTHMGNTLDETKQRLEMVKGHHSLALEANESIRREYKVELETIKSKLEEEKQAIITKAKTEQDSLKSMYAKQLEALKEKLTKEKLDVESELHKQINVKDLEMKAKLEQIDEATNEKLKLCEIQFEERFRSVQEHWNIQEEKLQYMDKEINDLKYSLSLAEEKNISMQKAISELKHQNEKLNSVKDSLLNEMDSVKEESKKKFIDFENEINKLTVDVDNANIEKNKYEVSLNVTRDIVHVLSMRLRESDNELEMLEGKLQDIENSKNDLESEIASYKNKLNSTQMECDEYKEALVNILKSKASLAKEHTRIMEHNVSLIECLQNVEMEAYRELGSIKNELIEDVELIKKESKTQIQNLQEEVEKKRLLCELATEHASQAAAAAEQSRALLAHAANEIARLESENQRVTNQIQDQQSLVVELSLLRQENEELAMTVAKQSSLIEKLKKDYEHAQIKPKSPSVVRKTHKIGKENAQIVVSPLRERNQ